MADKKRGNSNCKKVVVVFGDHKKSKRVDSKAVGIVVEQVGDGSNSFASICKHRMKWFCT